MNFHNVGSACLKNFVPGFKTLGRDFIFPSDYTPTWLVSYPKSGNTWLRFLISNALSQSNSCVNFEQLEYMVPDLYTCNKKTFARHKSLKAPHFIKSHECYNPMYKKVVYIVRDPRDVAVSYYWHFLRSRRIRPNDLNVNSFVEKYFIPGFNSFGNWLEHVKSWSSMSDHTTIMTLKYEDMKDSPHSSLDCVLKFADNNYSNNKYAISKSAELSKFSNLKELEKQSGNTWSPLRKVKSDIPFFREGKSHSFNNELEQRSIDLITSTFSCFMKSFNYH